MSTPLVAGRVDEPPRYRFSGRFSISKKFLLQYPDGSKKHVSRAERDDLLLSGLAKQTAPQRYLFTGQQRTLHSLAELSTLNLGFEAPSLRRFLPGSFIFEHKGKRRRELMETPDECGVRLPERVLRLVQA